MNRVYKQKKGAAGFSLIELALVFVVMGVVASVSLSVLPSVEKAFSEKTKVVRFNTSYETLVGFILAHNRLPCPDINDNGVEDCQLVDGKLAQTGKLPFITLGLTAPVLNGYQQALGYGVYRNANVIAAADGDLTQARNRFEPRLPAGQISNQNNGLDFCIALRLGARTSGNSNHPYLGDAASALNQALFLVDPGASNADGAGGLFDGANFNGANANRIESPSRGQSGNYDDQVFGMGFSQLAAQLNCPLLMAKVNGAARSAVAADDIQKLTNYYESFRRYGVEAATDNIVSASFGVALAGIDTVIFVAQNVTAIAAGFESFGLLVATFIIPAAVGAALTAAGAVLAGIGLADEIQGKIGADQQLLEAQALNARVSIYATAQLSRAYDNDLKGWLQ